MSQPLQAPDLLRRQHCGFDLLHDEGLKSLDNPPHHQGRQRGPCAPTPESPAASTPAAQSGRYRGHAIVFSPETAVNQMQAHCSVKLTVFHRFTPAGRPRRARSSAPSSPSAEPPALSPAPLHGRPPAPPPWRLTAAQKHTNASAHGPHVTAVTSCTHHCREAMCVHDQLIGLSDQVDGSACLGVELADPLAS